MADLNRNLVPMSRRPKSRVWLFAAALVLEFSLSACVSIIEAPILEKADTGSQMIAERDQLVAMFGGPYKADPALIAMIAEVTDRIVRASDDPKTHYRLTILNSPNINAFALPSGDIFITRGLVALANDTSEIGAVIAHEIAHVTSRHASRRAEFEQAVTHLPKEIGADEATMAGDGNRFRLASFSRSQELEADEIGIKILARAGYDPYGASRFLLALNRMTAVDLGQSLRHKARTSFLSTHPSTPQRLTVAIDTAARLVSSSSMEADHDMYLMALDGLLFGDDPDAGLINGRHFYHPRLDFSFEAPYRFSLENSAEAIIGVSINGDQSMRLDTIPARHADDAYKSNWIENIAAENISPITVGGFRAFTATAKDDAWQYRLAAIEKDGKLFRMIFAARELTAEIDHNFLSAIRSFRSLTPSEFEILKPLKISIARAESGDTIDTMAARMVGLPHAQDLFRLLNGTERSELRDGTLYKFVLPK